VNAASPFAVRGIIEGFYGEPWSHEQRLDIISFIADRGMNTFVYSPKDDPLVRRDWRVAYSGEALGRLAGLVEACDRRDIRFIYCVSPGLSIEYSSPADLVSLTEKIASVASLGVTRFGLLLDDIPLELQHESDRAAYADLVTAHIDLVSKVYESLAAGGSLIVCPTVYCGYGDEEYLSRLGRSVDPRIDLFWTGREICSATIDLADAAAFARSTARPATYWDNYPVNDVAMTHELHVGPYQGRDRHLFRFATGVIANGMELFESSKIAFATIADYLADPEAYDSELSWRRAIDLVAGEADGEAYALFADNVRTSCLSEVDAPSVSAALGRFMFRLQRGEEIAAGEELRVFAERLSGAARHLLNEGVANLALVDEARPWIEKFSLGADVMLELATLAAEGALSARGRGRIESHLASLRELRQSVFGAALEMTLTDLLADAEAVAR
jgi:hyaluronoglucosaminidase